MATLLREQLRETGKASASRFYRPELDGLRFCAFLLVFLCHATTVGTGWIGRWFSHMAGGGSFGVDLFFVLSAYLITELLRREKLATGTVDIGRFYVRRILRIWPLYFGFLIVFFLLRRASPAAFPPPAFLAFALFCGNWYIASREASSPYRSAVVPLWSIAVEEQFYLVWPLIARFAGKAGMIAAASCLAAASLLTQFLLLSNGATHAVIWVNSLVHGGAISIGVISALVLEGRAPTIRPAVRLCMVAGALVLFAVADGWLHFSAPLASVRDGMAAFACGWLAVSLLFFSFLGAPEDGLRLPAARALVYGGRISYGLYVFHVAVLDVVGSVLTRLTGHYDAPIRFAIALACTLVLAALSYRFFESRFLALKRRFERIPSGGA